MTITSEHKATSLWKLFTSQTGSSATQHSPSWTLTGLLIIKHITGSNHLPGGWLPTTQHAMPSHEHDFWMWWGECQKQETSKPKRLNPSQWNPGVHRADLYLRSGCYQVITTEMLRPSQGVNSYFIRESTLHRLRLLQNSKAQLPMSFTALLSLVCYL